VADVAAIADHLGVDRFAVQGGSGGGPHCLAVAARLADRVLRAKCTVGVAPWGLPDLDWFDGMDPMNVAEFGWALQGEQVLVPELEREAAEMVARVAEDPANVLGGFELSEADRAALQDELMQRVMREWVPASFARGVWGWVDDDLAFTRPWGFDLAEIAVPVEVRYGATDVLVPAAHGQWLARNVPGAEVHVEQDEGHMGDPERILSDLSAFVAAASAA
jgi:pimeloyl-ACP methyl ester carboxylesterase